MLDDKVSLSEAATHGLFALPAPPPRECEQALVKEGKARLADVREPWEFSAARIGSEASCTSGDRGYGVVEPPYTFPLDAQWL